MYVNENSFESDIKAINALVCSFKQRYKHSPIDSPEMLLVSELENQVCSLRDSVFTKYSEGGTWLKDHSSSRSAIELKTHLSNTTIVKALERGKLLEKYDNLADALNDNFITSDHVDMLVKCNSEKYCEFFSRDIDLLVENACVLSPRQFCNVLAHWRNNADDIIDDPSNEMQKFESRYLELNQLYDGNWYLHAILDNATGTLVDKAMKSGVETLWNHDTPDARANTTKSQYRCDHLGNVFRGYINSTIKAEKAGKGLSEGTGFLEYNFVPSISTDVIIDIEKLYEYPSTRKYLTETLKKSSPIYKAHSKSYVDQILCDSQINFPIRNIDGTITIGRKNRVASVRQKRELALESNTCSIKGCSIPASWCDAHHIHHWAKGGETKNSNLVLLCSRHHHKIHNDKIFATKTFEHIFKQKQLSSAVNTR